MRTTKQPHLVTACLFMLAAFSTAYAGQPFTDTFEDGSATDGSPVTWERVAPPFDLGTIEVINGNLTLTAPNSGPPTIPSESNYWEMGIASQGKAYHDVDIRTQVRAPNLGTSAVVIGALDTYYTQGDSGTGVYFGFVVDGNNTYALINSEIDGARQTLDQANSLDFSHLTSDLNLRLTVRGLDVSAWAWPADTLEPIIPLLQGQLSADFADVEGRVELGAGSRSTAVPVSFRYVSVVPEPNTLTLLAAGLPWLLRRRNRPVSL